MSATEVLLAPHNDLETYMANQPSLASNIGRRFICTYPAGLGAYSLLTGIGRLDDFGADRASVIFNGSTDSSELRDKYRFAQVIRGLGYLAPATQLVLPSDTKEEVEWKVESVDYKNEERFCKPLHSAKGIGARVTENTQQAQKFIAKRQRWPRLRGPYLVQENLSPDQDWRYILHRDQRQLEEGSLPWRIAYPKVRPIFIGDGQSSVGSMVLGHEEMSRSSKVHLITNNLLKLGKVPEEGEIVDIVKTGNISKGAHSRPPEAVELEYLDRFMLRVLGDLEEHYGRPFGTLCFDIGILDSDKLTEQNPTDNPLSNVVFYEQQIPFGFSGYLANLARLTDSEGSRLVSRSQIRNISFTLSSSIVASGRYLRRRFEQAA